MRKILYSPGYGAGWTSWCAEGPEMEKFMLEYQPIIEYLEAGNSFVEVPFDKIRYTKEDKVKNPEILPACLQQFVEECWKKFGRLPYLGGARDLKVATVEGLVRIEEYDGSESIHGLSDYDDDWM